MLRLELTLHGNPDYNQGDWEEKHEITAENITELRKKIFAFQAENDVGGGNWGVATLHDGEKVVGLVSYNGRVWDGPYPANEIIL